jgi:Bacterial Ig domain/Calx-beta domain
MSYRTSVLSRRNLRAYIAAFISYLMLAGQAAPLALASAPTAARSGRAAESGLTPAGEARRAPAPLVLAGPTIVATKTDAFPVHPSGKADPGDTITYTVTVSNTGTGDATGVTFNDSVDPNTTLVPGSVNTQPIADPDSYNVIGNVRIQPNAAQGLLANDRDPDTGNNTGLTASGPTTSTQNGNVAINADGSFSYNPPPGFTGTDTFTYTITDAGGKTDTGVATFTVGNGTATPGVNVVWFVNPSAPSGGDGRLTSPFNCYTGGSASCFSQTAADDPGDAIFLFSGAHTGGYTLLASQKLIGQGASDTLPNLASLTVPTASDALPATSGASPTITTANVNAIPLSTNNLLRGFTVGNTGTGTKISGTGFGTLTVGNNTTPDVTLNGTGKALDLTTGAFAATSAFSSVTTTSSATQGISLAGITGTVSFGSTTVSGSTTQGILIGTTTAAINFGNTSVTGGSDGVSFQNNSSGTRTFGTLGVSGGTGSAFLSGAGGGNVTVNGAATLTSAADVINIANSTNGSSVSFAGGATVTKTTTGGNGVNWSGTNTGATLSFATLALTTSNGTGMNLAGGGTVNVTTAAGSSISTTGVGAQVAPTISATGVALGMNFTTIASTNSGGSGMFLNTVSGALTTGTTNMQNPTGIGIVAASSSVTLNFGTTTVNGSGSTSISLGGSGTGNTGPITFGSLSVTPDSGQRGILAQQNTGTITSTSGTVTTTNATAVEITGTNSGSKTPLNVTLTAVNTTGGAVAPNGILLRFTSDAGTGFTVTGNGGTCTFASSGTCTGGRITNTSGADSTTNGIGVYLEDVADINLTRMHIDGHPNFAVRGKTNVAGFQLLNSVVDGNNGTSNTADTDVVSGEDSVRFNNLTGSALIDNCTIAGGFFHNLRVTNNTGTLNRLTVQNSFIGDPDAIGSGQRGLVTSAFGDDTSFEAKDGITAMNVTLLNNTINFGGGRLIGIFNNDNAGAIGTMDAVVRGNTLVNANPFATQAGASHVLEISGLGTVTYEVACNKIANSLGIALLIFKGKEPTAGGQAANFSGTIFNNTVGITGQSGSGGGFGTSASAINVDFQGTGTGTVLVKNNVIRRQREAGIRINHIDTNNSTGRSSTLNATVIGNTVTEPDQASPPTNSAFANVYVNAGADPTTDVNQVTNLKVGNASVAAEKNNLNDGDAVTFDAYVERVAGTLNLSRAGSASSTPSQILIDDNIVNSAQIFANAAAVPVNTTPALPAAINETCTPPSGPETFDGDAPTGPGGITTESATATQAPTTTATASTGNNVTGRAFILPRPSTTTVAAATRPAATTTNTATRGTTTTTTTSAAPIKRDPIIVNGSGGLVSINIGTLRAGDSVTITFQATIDVAYAGGPNVSNQGTVTFNEAGSPVLTDDPATGAAGDPTLTPVNATDIRVNDAKESEPASGTRQMLFTVTLSTPAASPLSVNYATANGGATPATGGASCDGTNDYLTTSGTVNFATGEKIKTVPVTVCADNVGGESSETFLLNLSSPSSGNIVDAQAVGTITQGNNAGTFLVSELRTSGPAGAGDDFVELYNNTNSPLTVASSDASAGYGVFKMGADCNAAPVLIATIPNGTVIPARGHRLLVGSTYSLANYGGTGAAAGDQTLTADIGTDANVAVFSTADVNNLSTAARLDAVGFGANAGGGVCDLLREGTNLGSVAPSATSEHSFFRKECDFTGGVGCQAGGNPKDSGDNSVDFLFADTQGTFISGVGQHLGAPGPERSTSPIRRDTSGLALPLLDGSQASSNGPNRVRDFTVGDPGTSPQGTLSIRRRVQNNTGAAVTRLRFRIIEMTTFPNPGGGTADLRAITSSPVVISGINDPATCASTGTPTTAPCQVTAQATTLETPPAQPNGGGYNSTLSVALPGPGLANGASVDVNFTLGVVQSGTFRFYIIIEALP